MSGLLPDPLTFRALFESTPQTAFVVLADGPHFTIVAVSDSYLRLTETTREHLTGKLLFETAPFSDVSPTEVTSLRAALTQSTGKTHGSGLTRSQTSHSRVTFDSGQHHWTMAVSPVFAAIFDPVFAEDGQSSLLVLTLERGAAQVTERATKQDTVQTVEPVSATSTRSPKVESIDSHANRSSSQDEMRGHGDLPGREELRSQGATRTLPLPAHEVFDHAVPGFAVFDLDGNIIDCNPSFARIVGRTREELQMLNAAILIHPEDLGRSIKNVERLIAGKSSGFVIEKRYLRPDGTVAWVRNSVSLIRGTGGHPLQLVTISEDLTLFRLAEHALIKNEKLAAVGRLSASIAHELNNPLEAVTNLLFLIGHSSEVDEIRNYARLAEQELGRVTQITTQTLRFYRHESVPAQVHMADVLDSVLALFEGRLRRRDVNVAKRYLPCADPLLANSGEIRQVFVNIISNALDAMSDRGQLRIDVRPSRNWEQPQVTGVRVTICDTGSGIPREMLQRIFEPFVSTKENHGTGLGLWISKEIIRRHGGMLRVRSAVSGPWRGTAMSVFLPREMVAVVAA